MVSKKAYRNGIFGSLVMVSCAYLLPILIATGATNLEQDEWKEGTFAVVKLIYGSGSKEARTSKQGC